MKQILLPAFGALIALSCGQGEKQAPPPPQQSVVQQGDTKTPAVLIAAAKENLAEAKSKLAQEGKYSCCMGEACNHCALAESSCTCADDLKHGEAVCNECYGGWQEGKGAVPGIKKENVKADFMAKEEKK